MRVLGGRLAQFGLHYEAAGRCIRRSRLDALQDLDPFAVAAPQLHWLGNEASIDLEEDNRLFSNRLDRVCSDRHRHCGFISHDLDVHEQTWPPCPLGVIQYHPRFGGSGLLAYERAHEGHCARR